VLRVLVVARCENFFRLSVDVRWESMTPAGRGSEQLGTDTKHIVEYGQYFEVEHGLGSAVPWTRADHQLASGGILR